MGRPPAHSPFRSQLLPDIPTSHYAVLQVCSPLTTSMSWSMFSPDGWRWWWRQDSLMEMAAHLVTLSSLVGTDPVGSTTMPANTFIESILNNRSNPSGLRHITSALILAELPSSIDMVTTLQHRQDIPPIIVTSTLAFFQEQHRSAFTTDCNQPILISAKHRVLST